MAFLNPSLLTNGTLSVDTATPLADYQQLRQKQKESRSLIDKNTADMAASRFDFNHKKYNVIQNARASLLADPTLDNYHDQRSNLQASGMFSDQELKGYDATMPHSNADVPKFSRTAGMYLQPNGEQLATAALKSSNVDLGDRNVQLLTDPMTGVQRYGAQYRRGVSPNSLVSAANNLGLIQQSMNPDPRIYEGEQGDAADSQVQGQSGFEDDPMQYAQGGYPSPFDPALSGATQQLFRRARKLR